MVQAAGIALESMAEVIDGLTIDPQRMLRNIESTHGTVFAEKAMMQLAETMGRDDARRLVEETLQKTGSPPERRLYFPNENHILGFLLSQRP